MPTDPAPGSRWLDQNDGPYTVFVIAANPTTSARVVVYGDALTMEYQWRPITEFLRRFKPLEEG